MFRYTRRKSTKKYIKAKMASKRKTTNTRRRRLPYPARRPMRMMKRRTPGVGSVIQGTSVTQPRLLNQLFTAGGIKWDQDGAVLSGSTNTIEQTQLEVTPDQIIDLVERQRVNKEFRITGVTYEFYKDALSSNNGAYGSASLTGNWDNKHSKMMYNTAVNAVPNIQNYSAQADEYLSQQRGVVLPTINGKRKFCRVRPKIRLFRNVNTTGSSAVDISQVQNYPWLNIEDDLEKNLATANCHVFIPEVSLLPLLDTNAGTYDLNTDAGRKAFAAPFQWLYRVHITWQTRGKYFDSSLAFPPPTDEVDAMADLNI